MVMAKADLEAVLFATNAGFDVNAWLFYWDRKPIVDESWDQLNPSIHFGRGQAGLSSKLTCIESFCMAVYEASQFEDSTYNSRCYKKEKKGDNFHVGRNRLRPVWIATDNTGV